MGVKQQLILGLCASLLACSSSAKHGSGSGGSGGSSSPGNGSGTGANTGSGTGSATSSGTAAKSGGGTGGTGGRAATGTGGSGGASGGTGGKAATGTGGTGGTSGGTGGTGGTSAGASVLERNNHPSRDGHFLQPTLTKAMAAKMARDTAFQANFTGNMWASPLYLENGPGGKGVFFTVTTSNDVFALDETTGSVVWTKHLGDSPTANGVSCGSIHPLGIVSTPVIDAATRTIYVAGAVGTTSIARHEVHALSVDDGAERSGWPVDVSKLSSRGLAFSPPPHNQRSALSLVGGTLYVAYGGHVGDCGAYHGWVVGIDTQDPTKAGAWATLGQGEGIWAAGGMASDGNGVFAITGNSTAGATDRASTDSEQVVRITGLGTFDRVNKNLYFPASWRMMDSQDADFGASNPIYLTVPGATPSNYVVAISKDGHLYLLDSANLGGMAGHVVDFSVATGAMSIHTVPAAYTTAAGVHVVFSTDSGGKCPSGGPTGMVVMSVLIPKGAPPAPTVAWCAALSYVVTGPVATTSDGQSDAIVWYMNNGSLTGVDGDTGAVVFRSTGPDTCNGIRKWTSPIVVKGRVVVGGDGNLCSWSPH